MTRQSGIRLMSVSAVALGLCWDGWCLRAGTVAWYRFEEGGTNYNVVTSVVDSGTNGLHGTVAPAGLLRYAPAKGAYAVGGVSALAVFGSGNAILPNASGIDLDHGFSVELLMRPFEDVPDPTQWHTVLVKRAAADPASDLTFKIEYRPLDREIKVWFRERRENGDFSLAGGEGALVRTPNGWNHLALTFSRSENDPFHDYEVALMLDGSGGVNNSGTDDIHADLGTGPFLLGGGFYGLVDEFRVSNAALAPEEMLVYFPRQELVATVTPKVEITFRTYRYNYYDVEWTEDLNSGVWQHLEPAGIDGTGFPITVTDLGGFGRQRYYRIYEYD